MPWDSEEREKNKKTGGCLSKGSDPTTIIYRT